MRILFIVFLLLAGCASPQLVKGPTGDVRPQLAASAFTLSDGYSLPFQSWGTDSASARHIVLGLHGFNDYSESFAPLAERLAASGITTYAVDQRGFGRSAQAGRWHGSQRLAQDLPEIVALLRERYPRANVYVAGESMGGAVAMLAARQAPLDVDGIVLIAPAVWSRATMPWYQKLALSAATHTVPWLKLTGEGIDLSPTDNRDTLRRMADDPLVIKATRVDALWGITDLMDAASTFTPTDGQRLLILYGERDEIIPKNAFCRLVERLPRSTSAVRLVLYAHGWHLLPRDLQGQRARDDIASWILDSEAALPSGEETALDGERLRRFCGD